MKSLPEIVTTLTTVPARFPPLQHFFVEPIHYIQNFKLKIEDNLV